MIPGNGKFATSSRAPLLFACGDGVRLYSAFDQYAVQAFDVNAVDYVLKPFDKARIAKAIARARKMLETQTSATERLEQLVSQLGAAKQNSSPPVKILVRSQQKLLLVDGED